MNGQKILKAIPMNLKEKILIFFLFPQSKAGGNSLRQHKAGGDSLRHYMKANQGSKSQRQFKSINRVC